MYFFSYPYSKNRQKIIRNNKVRKMPLSFSTTAAAKEINKFNTSKYFTFFCFPQIKFGPEDGIRAHQHFRTILLNTPFGDVRVSSWTKVLLQ